MLIDDDACRLPRPLVVPRFLVHQGDTIQCTEQHRSRLGFSCAGQADGDIDIRRECRPRRGLAPRAQRRVPRQLAWLAELCPSRRRQRSCSIAGSFGVGSPRGDPCLRDKQYLTIIGTARLARSVRASAGSRPLRREVAPLVLRGRPSAQSSSGGLLAARGSRPRSAPP